MEINKLYSPFLNVTFGISKNNNTNLFLFFSGARASGLNQGLGALAVQSPSPPDGSAGNGGVVSPIPAPSAP